MLAIIGQRGNTHGQLGQLHGLPLSLRCFFIFLEFAYEFLGEQMAPFGFFPMNNTIVVYFFKYTLLFLFFSSFVVLLQ